MVLKKLSAKSYTSRKLWLVGLPIIVVLCGGAAFYLLHRHAINTNDGGQTKYNQAKKEAVVDNGGVPVNDSSLGKGSTPSTTYAPPTDSNGISITPRSSGSNVSITTKLVGYSDGVCNLTITNGGKTTSQTANVIFAANFSTCAGFTIPISTLSNGSWVIKLDVVSGDNTTTKTTTYEVGE